MDKKKGRLKRAMGWHTLLHRSMGILLAAAVVFNTLPPGGFPVSASENVPSVEAMQTGLCIHHRSHTEECGYREAQPCTHEHTDGCYETVTECVHTHTEDCYPQEAGTEGILSGGDATPSDAGKPEPDNCTHVCKSGEAGLEESGCIVKELNCTHEHDESCGAAAAQECSFVCEICNSGTSGEDDTKDGETEEPETGDLGTEENSEQEDTEEENPEQEDTEEENAEPENTAQEDTQDTGLCPHHGQHTEECGYTEGTEDTEGTPCAYECRICPIEELIAALPDEVTEDNADEVQAQLDEILALYRELTEEEQEQIDLSRCYELQAALDTASTPMLLAGNVTASYRKATWNGSEVVYSNEIENTCTSVTDSTSAVTWTDGWYVVDTDVTIFGRITVTGNVNLILTDGCTLNASKGITVSSGNSLTIYGQTGDTGRLIATGGSSAAGIGGYGESSGNITIHGGTVEATGGNYASGIGGGYSGSGSGITIHGGTVEATGGNYASGIGGGYSGNGSDITIRGGMVEATGGISGAGIGGGSGSSGGYSGNGSGITISGGTVTATGGNSAAGIGGGDGGKSFFGGGDGSGITISGGTVTARGGSGGAGIGGGEFGSASGFSTDGENGVPGSAIIIASSIGDTSGQDGWNGVIFNGSEGQVYGNVTLTEDLEIPNGKNLAIPGGAALTIPDGKEVTVPEGVTLTNDGTLTIETDMALTGNGALGGNGSFITENLTSDMIFVPSDMHYTSADMAAELEKKVTITGRKIFGQPFTVDMDEWILSVKKKSDLVYTATYSHSNKSPVSKDIILLPCLHNDGEALTHHEKVEADCTHTGTLEYWDCSVCEKKFSDKDGQTEITNTEIPITHKLTHHEKKEADCTQAGNTEYWECSVCGKKFSDENGGTEISDDDAVIPVKPHDLTHHDRKEAGCLTEGNIEYWRCSECGKDFSDSEGKAETTDITIPAAGHQYESTHVEGSTTHKQTCSVCGDMQEAEKCSYSFSGNVGTCQVCRSKLTVSVSGTEGLVYDGTAKQPTVAVTVDGTTLTVDTDYSLAYESNINAGVDAASVKVTGKKFDGAYTKTFSIAKAAPAIAWGSATQDLTYTGRPAAVTGPAVTLANNETFSGTINYSYKTADGSAYKDGLPTDVGTYTVRAGIAGQRNYEAAESTDTLTLTISRADGELTVPETVISKTFGEGEFSLNCSTNGDGKIFYASDNKNVAEVSADGTVLIKGVGTATVTVSLAAGTNYTGADNQTVTVTVGKAAEPSINAETRNYTYTNGSNGPVTVDVAGKFPKDKGKTTYSADIVEDSNSILSGVSVDGNGNLAYTVAGNKADGDKATIKVTAQMANYEDAVFTLEIELVAKKTVEPKAGSVSVSGSNILIYGQELSSLTFAPAVFVEQGTDKEVAGTLTWNAPSSVPDAGTASAQWIFTPEDNTEYIGLTGTAPITVAKATPVVTAPVADAVTYNPSGRLDSVRLNGGSATWTVGGNKVDVEGTWSWKDGSDLPTAGNSGYTAVFTPKDGTNYNTVERTVAVAVDKAVPYIAAPPAAAKITYGDALDASTLTGGTVQYSGSDNTAVAGSFAWKDSSIKPAVSDSGSTEYAVVFTPDDSKDYSSVETKITLTVEPAENAPDMPSDTMNVPKRCEKVSDVGLPAGWQWQEADRDTALGIDKPVTAVAVYTGADKDNYKNTSVTVAITRADCDHENTELRNAVAANCQRKGYSGDTYCMDCGMLLAKGNETPVADHSGGTAACIKGRVCEMCGAEYTGKDKDNHTHIEIRGQREAACTADGYTGDLFCTDCGAKTGAGTVIPATGHDWHVTSAEEATTASEGKRTYTCSNCGLTRDETIPKLPQPSHAHNYIGRETKAATCTETGVTTYSCSCGDSYTQNTVALGHDYRSSVTQEPTVSADGVMAYTCIRCGDTYTKPIRKLEDTSSKPGDRPEPGKPFIKEEPSKEGWKAIREESDKAEDESSIIVDMNGTMVVPGNVLENIRNRDITIVFDMGNGITWSVNGMSVKEGEIGDIDFSVQTDTEMIPVDIVDNIAGESYSIQLNLSHEGEFGFTAVLSINLGKENAGLYAKLFYYNESTGELEIAARAEKIADDGSVSLAFTHASKYVVVVDREDSETEGSNSMGNDTIPAKKEDDVDVEQLPNTDSRTFPWSAVVIGILLVAAGIVYVVFATKKKDA